jgi:hypothetical protein
LAIIGLTLGVICLFRTNQLSGNVIGSLGQKAEEADSKAQKAITDSGTALTKAGEAAIKAATAEDATEKALSKSDEAKASASHALILAHGARQEAASIERDLALARADLSELTKAQAVLKWDIKSVAARAAARPLNSLVFLAQLKTLETMSAG